MARLLDLAAREVAARLNALPIDEKQVAVYRQVEAAIADATNRLNFAMNGTMQQASRQAIGLGVRLAEATLPGAVPFALPPVLLEQLAVYQASLIRGLTDELRNDITQTIQLGMLAGNTRQEMVRDVVGHGLEPVGPFQSAEARADTIVRTEVNRISVLSSYQRGKAAAETVPGLRKRWLTARDNRVRPSHVRLNGVEKPMEEDFSVGGSPAAHPLDARLPASEVIHCRCRLVFQAPPEAP